MISGCDLDISDFIQLLCGNITGLNNSHIYMTYCDMAIVVKSGIY